MELTLTDGKTQVRLAYKPGCAAMTAEDFLFEVLAAPSDDLISQGILALGQKLTFEALVKKIFDRDSQGLFIREGIRFSGKAGEITPETPMSEVGDRFCLEEAQTGRFAEYRLWFLLHMLAIGRPVDVIHVNADLEEAISDAEHQSLIEIDTQKAVYRLSSAGERLHQQLMDEAQDLIRRFDIFADVVLSPEIRFKTGFGQDLRIPLLEQAGIDPFRARFILGLNDGEWDDLPDWAAQSNSEHFYDEVFSPVEQAPSLQEIGESTLSRVMEKAHSVMQEE